MDRRTEDMDFEGLETELDDDDNFFDPSDRLSTAVPLNLADFDDDDDEFFEASRMSLVSASIKRIMSIKSASIKRLVSINPNVTTNQSSTSVILPTESYDMWIAEPGDLNERRKRLLQGMGLTSKKEFLRLATSKRVRAISIKIEPDKAQVPTPELETSSGDVSSSVVGEDSSVSSTGESKVDGGGYRAIVLVRSRSESDIELFSQKIKQRKEDIIGPISKNKLTRTLSGQLVQCTGASQYACTIKLFPENEKTRQPNPNNGVVITDDGFGSFFLIKNLDTGNDFIVKDINEEGMWNSLNDVQTGKQLTMEEFEKSVGYSPVVKELMRRASRNITDGRKVKKGFRNSSTRKGASFLKSIKGAATSVSVKGLKVDSVKGLKADSVKGMKVDSVKGLKVDSVKGLKADSVKGLKVEREEQKEDENSSSSTKPKSRWVDAHQYGKTFKEFTALHLCQEIRAHEGSIWAMTFSSDSRFLASGGEDSVIHVWEVHECEAVMSQAAEGGSEGGGEVDGSVANKVEISSMPAEMWRKGKKSGKGNPVPDYVKVPETVVTLSETPICSFEGHTDQVLDLCWSTSQVLLSSSMDKTVKMWDLETKSCLKTFPHKDYVTCIQFNPVDEKLFISGSLDGKVRIWSIPDNRVADWTDFHEMVTAASYAPDAQGAIVGSQEGTIKLYSTEDSRLEHQIDIQKKKPQAKKATKIPGFQTQLPLGKITGLQFAPWNQSEVLVTSADSRIGIYNGPDIVQKFKGFKNTSSQISASFMPHGKHIISASEDSQVYIWKVEELKNPTAGKKKTAVIIQAHEHFQCKDVSVAITWPGSSKIEPPAVDLSSKRKPKRPNIPPLPPNPTTAAEPPPEESGDNSNTSSSSTLPPLPKKKAEENTSGGDENESPQLELNSESVSDGESASSGPQTTSGDSVTTSGDSVSSTNTIPATAWGVVIVTASLEGEIKVYQNFGLPLKLARPLF